MRVPTMTRDDLESIVSERWGEWDGMELLVQLGFWEFRRAKDNGEPDANVHDAG